MSLNDELTEVASRHTPHGRAAAVLIETDWMIQHCRQAAANGKFEFKGIMTKGVPGEVAIAVAIELCLLGIRASVEGPYVIASWGPLPKQQLSWWQRLFRKSLPKAKVV